MSENADRPGKRGLLAGLDLGALASKAVAVATIPLRVALASARSAAATGRDALGREIQSVKRPAEPVATESSEDSRPAEERLGP